MEIFVIFGGNPLGAEPCLLSAILQFPKPPTGLLNGANHRRN